MQLRKTALDEALLGIAEREARIAQLEANVNLQRAMILVLAKRDGVDKDKLTRLATEWKEREGYDIFAS